MESLFILIGVLVVIILFSIFTYFRQKRILKPLSEEEFRAGYRKAQLIDIREQREFDGGHILGARNIPLSQLKIRIGEIRSDKPVYLYCQNGMRSGRAAQLLYKKGIRDLYQLKGGFKHWTGKIKRK
ncbi:rhodanese-like domain-containing protein [Jeotgalibacillus soli]|uniref:Rhodanese domain-containing protein n=1 Tax=Jeotgalibacillus soli TaxID=889306 RepID=A0A0C2V5W0_9BACL|nr:rhodanese-like domain-containing protein [Jeotgalibacillus soli]KIL44377.1 hypothetical protein KP78_33410 [Jeotgalibacillus soli]